MTMEPSLIDFFLQLQACDDVESSWRLFSRAIGNLGFSNNTYVLYLPSDDPAYSVNTALTNFATDFLSDYDALGGLDNDITALYPLTTGKVLHWSDPSLVMTVAPTLTTEQMAMEVLSLDYNIRYGASIPLGAGAAGSRTGMGLSATGVSRREYEANIKPSLDSAIRMARLLELHVSQFAPYHLFECANINQMTPFNDMERETVRWLSGGYSIKEIADKKLFRSVESINLYIKGAKRKLRVRSRDQLIARAVLLGLI